MKKVYIVLFLSIFMIIIFSFIPQQQALVFQLNDSTGDIAYIPTKAETHFQIKYTHSIHLSDVVESYKITVDKKIHQYELEYEDFSIGMPSNAEEGETFEHINGSFYIKNMNRIFPFFHLRIGQVRANHTVIFQNEEYPLSQSIPPGSSVKVEIRKLNLIELWKGVNILESL